MKPWVLQELVDEAEGATHEGACMMLVLLFFCEENAGKENKTLAFTIFSCLYVVITLGLDIDYALRTFGAHWTPIDD
jgi:hypothetical protein